VSFNPEWTLTLPLNKGNVAAKGGAAELNLGSAPTTGVRWGLQTIVNYDRFEVNPKVRVMVSAADSYADRKIVVLQVDKLLLVPNDA